MVRVLPIVEGMLHVISTDKNWQTHFSKIVSSSKIGEYVVPGSVTPIFVAACEWLVEKADDFQRHTLQTRFFETGDNFYLGMEMLREYNRWKTHLVDQLMSPFAADANELGALRKQLIDGIDRLWYSVTLETIRTGDVYNPGARHRVPKLHLINSHTAQELRFLPIGESFRVCDSKTEKFEILEKRGTEILVRNVEGYVAWMPRAVLVFREGNLTRSPDGNQESKVVSPCWMASYHFSSVTYTLLSSAGPSNISCLSLCQPSNNALVKCRKWIRICFRW